MSDYIDHGDCGDYAGNENYEEWIEENFDEENYNHDYCSEESDSKEGNKKANRRKRKGESDYESDTSESHYSSQFAKYEKDKPILVVPTNERKTMPYLTKFEKARVIGARFSQLFNNSFLMSEKQRDMKDHYEMAEFEFNNGLLPFKIRRFMPDGRVEIWDMKELSMDYLP